MVGGKFDPGPADFERMGAGKVGSVRVNLAWATVQRNGPSEPYDWSRYDALMSVGSPERDRCPADDLRDAGLGRGEAEPPSHGSVR